MMQTIGFLRAPAWAGLVLAAGVLAGCGSSPSKNISLPGEPPPKQAAATPDATAAAPVMPGDVRAVPVRSMQSRPGCRGKNCPVISIESVAFPDVPGLTQAVDRGLAAMTGTDANLRGAYQDLAGYTAYFWRTAQMGDRTYFNAVSRGVVGDVVSVELHTGQMLAGAAHSIPATRFLMWRRSTGREITLDDVLIAGRHEQYIAALRAAHGRWLPNEPAYKADPAGYGKLWPFVENTNVALTAQGVVVKYDAYSIAPYSSGEPEIVLPWETARDFVRPEFWPK
jgi:hypothetical protein